MIKFKVGDRVKRVSGGSDDFVKEGKIYTVIGIQASSRKNRDLLLFGNSNVRNKVEKYFSELFELVTEPEFVRGERVLVQYRGDCAWHERIYLATIKGARNPYIATIIGQEENFYSGKGICYSSYNNIKKLPKKKTVELTPEEVIKKLKEIYGDDIKIVIKE